MAGGTVIVGVDGSEQSRRALRWAVRQAWLTGARLEAVLAWEPPFSGTGGSVTADGQRDLQDVAAKVLAESLERTVGTDPPVEITARAQEGTPAQVLLTAAAEEDVTLLVVGSRGLGGFTGALLGSVSQYCAQHAPCPVTIVRGR
ncbi:universal stress protein [Streptomyces sp. SP17BM10]|uniref:universal stress protein n=1 Tax=Streptomyces sp. SP17BM10 TaxID=3002530 RepID=UPI002E789273|nr:universal stress protein [Streptomyces sp. SP17BM10]MEE1786682.1 universal stress protein [Streptomyces sp. SP17BM10]